MKNVLTKAAVFHFRALDPDPIHYPDPGTKNFGKMMGNSHEKIKQIPRISYLRKYFFFFLLYRSH